MPELPEVETVRNKLKKELINKKILSVDIIYANIIAEPAIEEFKNKITNQTIKDIKRIGKWLIFILDDYALLSHLRMEGKYLIKNKSIKNEKHEHVVFNLDDGNKLIYKDVRKFGKMYLKDKLDIYTTKPLIDIGKEPFDMDVSYLKEKIKNKRLPIKTILLDQSIIAGLGNIYDNEVLYLSKIHPLETPNNLTDKDYENIINNSVKVLNKAIKLGGTTIINYESLNGQHGNYQDRLNVHGKDICKICGTNIEKIKVNGRGTYYCPNCQQKRVDNIK